MLHHDNVHPATLPSGGRQGFDGPFANNTPTAAVEMVAAPAGWVDLAMGRESRRGAPSRRWLIARAALVPAGAGFSVVTLATVSGSWTFGFALVGLVAGGLFSLMRMSSVRYWTMRMDKLRSAREAAIRREALLNGLPSTQQRELVLLESIVEGLRAEYRGDVLDDRISPHELLDRLDQLLLLFVDLGTQLHRTSRALDRTAGDRPTLGEGLAGDGDVATEAVQRQRRMGRLRMRAQRRGRARMEELKEELRSIGQLVRLVHEQIFSACTGPADLGPAVGQILDDAELLLGAHAMVDDYLGSHGE